MAGKNTVEIILSARDQASKAVKVAMGSVQSSASAAMSTIKNGAMVATAAMVTLTGAISKVGVGYNAMMEQSAIAWETILGSQEEAKKTLKELEIMGAKTPFEFEGLDKAAKLLNMAGYEGDNLFKTLTAVGDAVSAIGGGQDELQGVSMAIFQMASKGKISAEEMNQLAERGIPAWKIIAEAQGKSVQELMKMSQDGKLFAEQVLPQLTEGLGRRFGGAMEKQSQTFNGMLSTIKDNLKMISAEMSKDLFEKLKSSMQGAIPLLNGYMELIKGDSIQFIEIITKAFGQEQGLKIIKFFLGARDAIQQFKGYVDLAKETINGMFNAFSGNEGAAVSILHRVGLSSEQVQLVLSAVEIVKTYITGLLAYWKMVFSGWMAAAIALWNFLLPLIIPALTAVVSFVKEKLDLIKQFWDENGAQIVLAAKNAFKFLLNIIKFIMPAVLFIVQMVWENIKGVIDGALNIIIGLIKIFAGIFTGDFSKMWEGIKQLFFGAVEFLWNLINLMMLGRILGGIKAFITKGVSSFAGFWSKTVEIFKNLDVHVVNIVNGFVERVVGFLKGLYTQGAQIFGTLRTFGVSIFQALGSAIRTVVSTLVQIVIGRFQSMYTGAKFAFQGLFNAAKSIFSSIGNAITNPIKTAKDLILGFIGKIKSAFANMGTKIPLPHFAVSNFSLNPKDWVKNGLPKLSVDWYDTGGIFYGPQIIGVGEKRPEFVGALDDLKDIVRSVIREEQPRQETASGQVPKYAIINIDGKPFMMAVMDIFIDEYERRIESKLAF
ncbi:tape measure protein [Mesobacillus subterraneus]|uniref:tape measure protein n=1 Tax=Mesobacillus subterraneus TaxID=285983 RepID=UPI00204193FC|nr:tape measure protein [Mesobacillus subterraneus]MCM3663447.1 tape measure protein [Mesobacillus subterraneus]MCM3683217.1 tape measure protein [Mesobacillus subterraneus]